MHINVHDTLIDHRKILRLIKILGCKHHEAIGYMICLWVNCIRHAVDGCLSDWSDYDIACAAKFEDDPKKFVDAIKECGFLDMSQDNEIMLHSWEYYAEFIKSAKRKRAEREKKKQMSQDVTGRHKKSRSNRIEYNRVEQSRIEQNKIEYNKIENNKTIGAQTATKVAANDVLKIFDHYRKYHSHAHPKPKTTSKEYKAIRSRLDEGYTFEQLTDAIDGCHHSLWHQGMNDRGKKYDSLELIMRDSSKVAQFIDLEHQYKSGTSLQGIDQTTMNNLNAGQRWLERMKAQEVENDSSEL